MARPRAHDLLRIRPDALRFAAPPDGWVLAALEAAPWVVTRRAAPIGALIPVGVRGDTREKRQAAQVLSDDVVEVLTPEALASRRPARRHAAFDALLELAPAFDGAGLPWGPIGAAGFELASGRHTLRDSSDLDIVLRVDRVDDLDRVGPLRKAIRRVEARIDIVIETPVGGVSFAEAAGAAAKVMVRSASGPQIMSWADVITAMAADIEPKRARG